MHWFLKWLRDFFGMKERSKDQRRLLGMYFDESNHTGRRKANRDRA